jgi:hypothetical protein
MMYTTIWLNKNKIQKIVNKIADENQPEKYDTILKELNVAEIRAENTPILNTAFRRLIGKKEDQIPVKLTEAESIIFKEFIQKNNI